MSIASLLDTDLYKLTMQACVHKHYKDAKVEYHLYNRSKHCHFTSEAVNWVQEQVNSWKGLTYTPDELAYLREELSYLPDAFFDFLEHDFKLDPENEVDITFNGGSDLHITIRGAWDTTIWYEVPVLSTVSEAYFRFVDTDWNMEGQKELIEKKGKELIAGKCMFSEFGTRRRRSLETQSLVVKTLTEVCKSTPYFTGTSNVHFARLNNVKPIGTVAHELMMGVAAYTKDYANANSRSMNDWLDTVGNDHAGVALTDTFGTPIYLKIFKPPYSDIYGGVRQDSGDPTQFTKLISQHYSSLGVKPHTKRIIFSDALNVDKCVALKKVAIDNGLIPAFGIGTFFTNDFVSATDGKTKSHPLNIVIKIAKVNGTPAIKLSDNFGKHTGDPEEVKRAEAAVHYSELAPEIDENRRWG